MDMKNENKGCLNCKNTINRLVYPRSKYCCGVCRSQYNKKKKGKFYNEKHHWVEDDTLPEQDLKELVKSGEELSDKIYKESKEN